MGRVPRWSQPALESGPSFRPFRGPFAIAVGGTGAQSGIGSFGLCSKTDLNLVKENQCTAVVCPRSNMHISGRLPNIEAMIEHNIPLAIGTDSLASVSDLDPLAEAALLCAQFPNVAHHHWMDAITVHGARLLARPDLGSLAIGGKPGVIGVKIPPNLNPIALLLDGTPWERYWAA